VQRPDNGTKAVSATRRTVWPRGTRGNTGTSSNLVGEFKIIVEIPKLMAEEAGFEPSVLLFWPTPKPPLLPNNINRLKLEKSDI